MSASIIVHGGAGDFTQADDPRQSLDGCLAAARLGHQLLAGGGSALDAVLAAVTSLEDDPTFNAGLGAALTLEGTVELDASVMSGDLRAGAVAAVRNLKNPASVARLVMEKTSHVMLAGPGAEAFARAHGAQFVPEGALITASQREKWGKALAAKQPSKPGSNGTVGAVACDAQGRVAAATSTGGMMLKLPGRVGDSPLIGCGTYADDSAGAASCTGTGEAIIKVTLARFAVDRLRAGQVPQAAAQAAMQELTRGGGDGGIILVDAKGRVGFAFNSRRMGRAWVDADGREGSGFS